MGKLTENLFQHIVWRLYFAGQNFCEFRDFRVFRKIISAIILTVWTCHIKQHALVKLFRQNF